MLRVLAHPVYARLLLAQLLSLLGSGLTTVALGLLAYDLAGGDAGAVLGTALALKMVAYVTMAPLAGALTANIPRKRLMVSLDLARAALVCLLPFVSEIWQIFVLVFAFQALSAAFTPTFQALIPDILPDERDYTAALSLSRLAYDLESLVSPLLAAALLTIMSFRSLFAGNALGFVASAALVASVAMPARSAILARPFVKRLTRGAWIYLQTPRLKGLLALSFALSCAGAMVIVNTVVLVQGMLGGTERDVALLFAAYGGGSMTAALFVPHLLQQMRERTLMVSGAVLMMTALPLGLLADGMVPFAALWLVLGLGASLVQTPSGLLLARSAQVEDRPSVYAAHFALSHACWLMAYPAAGYFGSAFGLSLTFLLLTGGCALGVLAALVLWPHADPLEIEHDHLELEHAHGALDDAHHDGAAIVPVAGTRHRHRSLRHAHAFVIDDHHPVWPR